MIDTEGNRFMTLNNNNSRQYKIGNHSTGYFKYGKLYGKGELLYKNRDKYTGDFKGSLKHGQGHMIYTSLNAEYKGNWKRNKREGYGVMEYSDGKIYNGNWSNDCPSNGELILTNGKLKLNQI